MRLIDIIILDGGSGDGGNDCWNLHKIVGKVYRQGDNRYLDYGLNLNYFSFYVEEEVWDGEVKNLDPVHGDYMIDGNLDELDKDIVLNRVVPAFYYSLLYVNDPKGRVRKLSEYTYELG